MQELSSLDLQTATKPDVLQRVKWREVVMKICAAKRQCREIEKGFAAKLCVLTAK